ncbi:hypothetical protein BLNAU_9101 [Blattamonas nauphoetae]|uniref:Uncharacterized protein n=1 Tax=Blattamonas nauphoetae TaxID=2049346 RepID=A0ABQ9XWU1_9EUKA|nr:hypothetical protein BLNAU_9101 [Blattamonas nauphoetae]
MTHPCISNTTSALSTIPARLGATEIADNEFDRRHTVSDHFPREGLRRDNNRRECSRRRRNDWLIHCLLVPSAQTQPISSHRLPHLIRSPHKLASLPTGPAVSPNCGFSVGFLDQLSNSMISERNFRTSSTIRPISAEHSSCGLVERTDASARIDWVGELEADLWQAMNKAALSSSSPPFILTTERAPINCLLSTLSRKDSASRFFDYSPRAFPKFAAALLDCASKHVMAFRVAGVKETPHSPISFSHTKACSLASSPRVSNRSLNFSQTSSPIASSFLAHSSSNLSALKPRHLPTNHDEISLSHVNKSYQVPLSLSDASIALRNISLVVEVKWSFEGDEEERVILTQVSAPEPSVLNEQPPKTAEDDEEGNLYVKKRKVTILTQPLSTFKEETVPDTPPEPLPDEEKKEEKAHVKLVRHSHLFYSTESEEGHPSPLPPFYFCRNVRWSTSRSSTTEIRTMKKRDIQQFVWESSGAYESGGRWMVDLKKDVDAYEAEEREEEERRAHERKQLLARPKGALQFFDGCSEADQQPALRGTLLRKDQPPSTTRRLRQNQSQDRHQVPLHRETKLSHHRHCRPSRNGSARGLSRRQSQARTYSQSPSLIPEDSVNVITNTGHSPDRVEHLPASWTGTQTGQPECKPEVQPN